MKTLKTIFYYKMKNFIISTFFLGFLLHIGYSDSNNGTSNINSSQPSKLQPIASIKVLTSQQPTSHTSTPTNKSELCSKHKSCGDCTKDYHCFWCEPLKECSQFKSKDIIPKGCKNNKWFWKQCVIPGFVLIIVVPVLAFLLLFCCGCCIYCKCCRTKKLHWKKEEEQITQRRKERQQKADEKKSERKKRTDALRMKYGLLRDNEDDEDPLI